MLDSLRVLDLTDERGFLAGKILGDLGADVIKVEPPGGDPERTRHGGVTWRALNTSKRGIVLDLAETADRERFEGLAAGADVVLTSSEPPVLRARGIDPGTLRALAPRLIVCAITPFGLDGPYASFRGHDLVAVAMGGNASMTGPPDRAPLRCSVPASYDHGAPEAVIGILLALRSRDRSGRGDVVDVSLQECQLGTLLVGVGEHAATGIVRKRNGARMARTREIWRTRDGWVSWGLRGGPTRAKGLVALVELMAEHDMAPGWLRAIDWSAFHQNDSSAEEIERLEDAFAAFFRTRSMGELFDAALERRILLAPCNDAGAILGLEQLRSRDFFVEVEDPERESSWELPDFFAIVTGPGSDRNRIRVRRRAPVMGEHQEEVLAELARDPTNAERRVGLGPPAVLEQRAGVNPAPTEKTLENRRGGVHPRPEPADRRGGVHPRPEPADRRGGVHPRPEPADRRGGVHPRPEPADRRGGVHPRPEPADRRGGVHPRPGLLEGLKVLELGAGAAGPIATRYLAEQGATVIRIETASRPDFLRMLHLTRENRDDPAILERAPLFVLLNPDKKSLSLDLRQAGARDVLERLVAWADVLSENFTPGVLDRWGLPEERLRALNPSLIVARGCLFGQTGPHRSYPGFGGQGSAISGFNHLTGWPDAEAHGPYGTVTDSLSPRFVAVAILAALHERDRTGHPSSIDVSQIEAAVYALSEVIARRSALGESAARAGNHDPHAAPHAIYPCAGEDRWIAIAAHDDATWSALVSAMGAPAWATDERFATLAGRLANQDELDERIAAWTAGEDDRSLMSRLQGAGIEAGAVLDYRDLVDDPQLLHRDHFVDLDHPPSGPVALRAVRLPDRVRAGRVPGSRPDPRPAQRRDPRHGAGPARGGDRATRRRGGDRVSGAEVGIVSHGAYVPATPAPAVPHPRSSGPGRGSREGGRGLRRGRDHDGRGRRHRCAPGPRPDLDRSRVPRVDEPAPAGEAGREHRRPGPRPPAGRRHPGPRGLDAGRAGRPAERGRGRLRGHRDPRPGDRERLPPRGAALPAGARPRRRCGGLRRGSGRCRRPLRGPRLGRRRRLGRVEGRGRRPPAELGGEVRRPARLPAPRDRGRPGAPRPAGGRGGRDRVPGPRGPGRPEPRPGRAVDRGGRRPGRGPAVREAGQRGGGLRAPPPRRRPRARHARRGRSDRGHRDGRRGGGPGLSRGPARRRPPAASGWPATWRDGEHSGATSSTSRRATSTPPSTTGRREEAWPRPSSSGSATPCSA